MYNVNLFLFVYLIFVRVPKALQTKHGEEVLFYYYNVTFNAGNLRVGTGLSMCVNLQEVMFCYIIRLRVCVLRCM